MVLLAVLGMVLIVGGRLFCVAAHPEWTETQALMHLWWLWVAGGSLLVIAAGTWRSRD